MKTCLNCRKEIPNRNKYCDNLCQREYEYKQWINRWKNGNESGLKGEYGTSNYLKTYLFNKYNNKCFLCRSELDLQIDHIIPVYKCYNDKNFMVCNNINNLQLLCGKCNIKKSNK